MVDMGYYNIITAKPRSEWIIRMREGHKVMETAGYKNLNEFADKDPANCARFLQACNALGAKIDPALAKKCGLREYKTEDEMEERC
jgi:precorrin-6x reductase